MKTAEEILLIEVKNYNGNYNSVLEFLVAVANLF